MKMTKLEKKFVNSRRHAQRNIKLIDSVFSQLKLDNVKQVLEIGCGAGFASKYLVKKYGFEVTGTDFDPEQIELAKTHHEANTKLKFFQADAAKLPFDNNEFDMILSINVFHHIFLWQNALKEIDRVLKPKGIFIFADFAYSKLTVNLFSPIVKNYGLYAIDDIIQFFNNQNYQIIYKKKSIGIFNSYRIVFQKSG